MSKGRSAKARHLNTHEHVLEGQIVKLGNKCDATMSSNGKGKSLKQWKGEQDREWREERDA